MEEASSPVAATPAPAVDSHYRPPLQIGPSPPIDELKLPAGTTHWGTDLEKLKESEEKMLAAANKTPDIVKRALSPKVFTVGGRTLHPFTVQTYLNLVEIGSPYAERKKPAPAAPEKSLAENIRDIFDALWVMIEDDQVVERLLAQGGEPLRAARVAFRCSVAMGDLNAAAEAISHQVARGFEPAANMHPPQQEGGGTPLAPTSSATAPAGS